MPKLGKLDDESLARVRQRFDEWSAAQEDYKGYRVTKYLDSGATARVYVVERNPGDLPYVLRISNEYKHNNQDEFQAVRVLMKQGQTHIVEYICTFAVHTDDDIKFCALMHRYTPLDQYRANGPDPYAKDLELAVRCGCDLLPLLQDCCELPGGQLFHRDIKPSNIFYEGSFRTGRGLMLGDFGIAKLSGGNSAMTLTGTPATMAPEICFGDPSLRSNVRLCDMYSLGVVMYYYLNNRQYPVEDTHDRTKAPFPDPAKGSQKLREVVRKATQYHPKNRFSSPQEMLEALQACDEYHMYISRRSGQADTAGTVEEGGLHCGNCGRRLMRGDAYCPTCGMAVAAFGQTAVSQTDINRDAFWVNGLRWNAFLLTHVQAAVLLVSMLLLRLGGGELSAALIGSGAYSGGHSLLWHVALTLLLLGATMGWLLAAVCLWHRALRDSTAGAPHGSRSNVTTLLILVVNGLMLLPMQVVTLGIYHWLSVPLHTVMEQSLLWGFLLSLSVPISLLSRSATDAVLPGSRFVSRQEIFGFVRENWWVYAIGLLVPSMTLVLPDLLGLLLTGGIIVYLLVQGCWSKKGRAMI